MTGTRIGLGTGLESGIGTGYWAFQQLVLCQWVAKGNQ